VFAGSVSELQGNDDLITQHLGVYQANESLS
jgi:hypothetical protein